MNQQEHRGTERLRLSIPIRIIGVDHEGVDFTEDTRTVVVNRAGARIAAKRGLIPGETIRLINLENYSEADFRVVGPMQPAGAEGDEWGVECVEAGRNVWGIELPPPLPAELMEAGALLVCRACQDQGLVVVSFMDVEVLESAGQIVHDCNRCGKPTFWTYAEVTRRPREFPPTEPVAPPSRIAATGKGLEKRKHKRLLMKMPIQIKNQKGEQEIGKTENLSIGGFAVSLAMDLNVGDNITVVCPYTPGGQNIEQKAEVRRRTQFTFGGMRVYGCRYVG